MIYWGNFSGFFNVGVPSMVLYPSLLVMFMAIVVGLIWWKSAIVRWRYTLWVLLVEYVFVVVCSTIIFRFTPSFKFAKLELTPFWTYEAVMNHTPGVSVWDIVLNVVLFIPLGFLVKLIFPKLRLWKMALIAICCSVFIETNQYFFEKGIAQIDDVMHNTIGTLIGWGIAKLVQGVWFKFHG